MSKFWYLHSETQGRVLATLYVSEAQAKLNASAISAKYGRDTLGWLKPVGSETELSESERLNYELEGLVVPSLEDLLA